MTETHPWFGATLAAHAELRPSAPAIIRDDGTVYFLGMSVLDEYAVYMAKPVN